MNNICTSNTKKGLPCKRKCKNNMQFCFHVKKYTMFFM